MSSYAAPLQIAAITALPLCLGFAVVLWSKVRAAGYAKRITGVDVGVRGMFRAVELQPMPERLALVVDALEEHDAIAAAAAAGRHTRATAKA
jgi:hypothetical protein